MDRTIPIIVSASTSEQQPGWASVAAQEERVKGTRTSADDLVLHPPLADDGEEERQRVHDGNSQAQL